MASLCLAPIIRRLAPGVAALAAILAAGDGAHAHRPYFTQIEKAVLPDGQMGEMRLLHGDGIIIADPVRVVLLDARGWIVARSHDSHSMVIMCDAANRCRVFDGEQSLMLDPDPTSFRPRALDGGEAVNYWDSADGSESWGFDTRRASIRDNILGNLALALGSKFHLTVFAVFGLLATFVAFFGIWGPERTVGGVILWMTIVAARVFGGIIIASFSLLWLAMAGLNGKLWLLATCLGGAIVIATDWWRYRRSSARL